MKKPQHQISLENKVITALNEDNSNHNTFHFIWSEDTESVMLNIVSCNSKNGQQFLLLTQGGITEIHCLYHVLNRIKDQFPLEYSWKVIWSDVDKLEHISYFRGANEESVRSKFYFHDEYSTVIEIERQPIS